MRDFLLSLTLLLSGWVLFSACNFHGSVRRDIDSSSSSPWESASTQKTDDIEFNSTDEVSDFLKFKRFSSRGSNIAFNGEGGTVDSEYFKVSSIRLVNPKEACISIYVPSVKLSGDYTLKINKDSVTLLDSETKAKYILSDK